MVKFKKEFDANKPLQADFLELVAAQPDVYQGVGLRDHCVAMHLWIRNHNLLGKMQNAFEVIPDQAMKPADAYHEVVRKNVELIELSKMTGKIQAVMMVPYPPGIPIIMGGEVFNKKAEPILDYLLTRQDFEAVFPGYEGDIHGVEREVRNGKTCFMTLCIKQKTGKSRK